MKKGIVLSDEHYPYQDEKVIELVYKFAKWFKPDFIVEAGDLLDFMPISRFTKDPLDRHSLEEELELARNHLKRFRKLTKKMIFTEGNHESVTPDTEILTINGWKRADEITEDDVIAQFDMRTTEITYDKPIKVSSYIAPQWVEVKTNQGYEKVTLNHTLIIDGKRVKVSEIKDVTQTQQYFAGYEKKSGVDLPDNMLRLVTWLAMDGTVVYRNDKVHHLQFKLSKRRKIQALLDLLRDMNIPFTIQKATKSGVNKLQPYVIRIYGSYAKQIAINLTKNKEFKDDLKRLTQRQIRIVLDVIAQTDGSKRYNHIVWSSTSKRNIDIIQYACITNGIPFKYRKNGNKGFTNSKMQYIASIYPYGLFGSKMKITVHNEPTKVISITMPEDTLITRVEGRVNFTGNSRLQKYISDNARELALLTDGKKRVLSLPTLLALPEIGVKFIPMQGKESYVKLNDLLIGHFNIARLHSCYSAKAILERKGISLITGHTHRLGTHYKTDLRGSLVAVENGCLCDLKPSYVRNPNWQHGFTVVYLSDGGHRFQVYNIPIVDYKFYFGSKLFEV